jgi:homopolymeric O-antigen transport system ATP-binding protein
MPDPAIRAQGLGKRYRLYQQRHQSLKEILVKRSLGRWQDLWAVRELDFEVPRGQVLGVIGENGSGKSTLLKLLNGILDPDEGSIEVAGRISALLELGAGFQPEYTGRENIHLYGALLGLRRAEVQERYDRIVEFSELGSFIEYPVKNYSSGMYMRLGFSVAVHLDPEVLLVDEILAVGDENFQQKCFRHLAELRKRGCTIVLVSHDLDSVGRFCDRVLWLDHGRKMADGSPDAVIQAYLDAQADRAAQRAPRAPGEAGGLAITDVRFLDEHGRETRSLETLRPLTVEIHYSARQDLDDVALNFTVYRSDGVRCLDAPSNVPKTFRLPSGAGMARLRFPRFTLHKGSYQATVAVYDGTGRVMHAFHDRLYPFRVSDPHRGGSAVVWIDYDWELRPSSERVRAAGE